MLQHNQQTVMRLYKASSKVARGSRKGTSERLPYPAEKKNGPAKRKDGQVTAVELGTRKPQKLLNSLLATGPPRKQACWPLQAQAANRFFLGQKQLDRDARSRREN